MSNLIRISSLLLIVLWAGSCREDFQYTLEDTHQELNFLSEINPEEPVIANLFKSYSLISEQHDIDLTQAQIDFGGTDFPTRSTKIIYIAKDENFALRNFDFRPTPGNSYWIEGYVPGTDMDTIRARTFVPEPVSLKSGMVTEVEKIDQGNGKAHYRATVNIELGEPRQRPAYFQIIPQRKVSLIRREAGQTIITHTNDLSGMDIVSINTARNAVQELSQKPGLFVDYSRLSGQMISIDIETTEPIDVNTEILKIIDFKINTLSEELYNYHINLHKHLVNNQSDYSAPLMSYSNIENGLGIFGSYSTTVSSIEI